MRLRFEASSWRASKWSDFLGKYEIVENEVYEYSGKRPRTMETVLVRCNGAEEDNEEVLPSWRWTGFGTNNYFYSKRFGFCLRVLLQLSALPQSTSRLGSVSRARSEGHLLMSDDRTRIHLTSTSPL